MLSFRKTCIVFAVVSVVMVALDRFTKAWAIANASGGVDFIPGFMNFTLVFNKGASFGAMQGATVLLLAVSVAICVAILVYLLRYRRHRIYEVVALAAVFAGAIGNAYDRAAYGQVTDFMNFQLFDFPVFNVADCCITIGIVVLLVFLLFSASSPFAESVKGGHGEQCEQGEKNQKGEQDGQDEQNAHGEKGVR